MSITAKMTHGWSSRFALCPTPPALDLSPLLNLSLRRASWRGGTNGADPLTEEGDTH